ncbi:MAG TPA: glycosyltransferase [Terracidiphilus sp.]|jgi:ceramide glucosyltransferase|nr:glycosyltransferase [Terracidiphilus sp.]
MIKVLLGVALLGTLTSTIFLALVLVASARFKRIARRRRQAQASPGAWPPVSLLKPLHGAEPGLREFLESFFALDYPQFEILFCARTDTDAGLRLAREVAAEHPHVPVKFLLSGTPPWPNARCYSLSVMAPQAAHDLLIITDSDVRVKPEFLREVVAPFVTDAGLGASTCLYRGDATGMGLWALLEGLGMSVEMTAGVVVADMLEGMRFTLGPCMTVRKDALESIGGFEKLGYYYADDFMLGNLVAESGRRVLLSSHVIDHCIVNNSFWHNFSHQWNWMKSTRFSRPWGHLGTGLTFAAPFGVLGLIAGYAAGLPLLGWALFGWAVLSRILMCVVAGGWVIGDPDAWRFCWLYPVRDALGAVLWAASYTSRRVGWRDDRFVLEKGGLMRKIKTVPRAPQS